MTDAVLTQAYDIENFVYCNENRAGTLFDVIHCMSCDFEVPKRALEYILKLGNDIEKRDDEGSTPLLAAALSFRPHAFRCLKAFIR
jgi:ankyrin repeat protein